MKTVVTLGLACILVAAAAVAGTAIRGKYALQGGSAKTNAYLLSEPIDADALARRLDLWLTPAGSDVAIREYDVDMTKMLHAVVISDDFTTFLHEHPQLETDGHFVLDQHLPHPGLYHLYADGEPRGVGQQVFRFDLQAGPSAPNDPSARDLSERSTTYRVDGYMVTLSSLHVRAGSESTLDVHIQHDGKPATDLHPYLGALAHAVFIDAQDLTYVHVHPVPYGAGDESMAGMRGMAGMVGMDMDTPAPGGASAPDMSLHVRVLEPGTYKLWLQFAGGSGLHVAQFVLRAA